MCWLWISLGLTLISGCTALGTVESRTQRVVVSADQLGIIREQIQAQACGDDQRVTVLGVEDRTGQLHLVIGCVGR